MRLREYQFFLEYNFYSMIGLVMASNASGYPEALCLLGKIFPKPHFRMTSHAAARTLRGAFLGTVKYYAQIHLQVWQNSVCTGQGNLPLIT